MAIPIIIPINTTRTRVCIIQNEVRYCESRPISKAQIGFALLISLAIILWMGFWMWLALEKQHELLALVCGLIAPLLIAGLLLIFI